MFQRTEATLFDNLWQLTTDIPAVYYCRKYELMTSLIYRNNDVFVIPMCSQTSEAVCAVTSSFALWRLLHCFSSVTLRRLQLLMRWRIVFHYPSSLAKRSERQPEVAAWRSLSHPIGSFLLVRLCENLGHFAPCMNHASCDNVSRIQVRSTIHSERFLVTLKHILLKDRMRALSAERTPWASKM